MLLQFDQFIAKHGEGFALFLIENWETAQKVDHSNIRSLEDRWEYFLQATQQYAGELT